MLKAEYERETSNMKWPEEDTVIMKEGVKVVLVWNKADTLKNVTMEVFVGMKENGNALGRFEKEGTVKIRKKKGPNDWHSVPVSHCCGLCQ